MARVFSFIAPLFACIASLFACFTSLVACNNRHEQTSTERVSPDKSRAPNHSHGGSDLVVHDESTDNGLMKNQAGTTNKIPDEAHKLHQKGRQLGASGDYKQANEMFEKASALAPDWPYPVYDMAFTYLLMGDAVKAREFYKKTVELAPRGFFTAITALDTLNREANGELPTGTYSAYMALEQMDHSQKEKAVASMVKHLPQFAPAWKEYATMFREPSKRISIIDRGLAATPDTETKGTLLINKALALNIQGETESAVNILTKLVNDPNTTLANEKLAQYSLKTIAH